MWMSQRKRRSFLEMTDAMKFTLPKGRLVMGSPFELQKKDHLGRDKDNPNYFIGVACPKTDPQTGEVLQLIYQVACRDFPGNQIVAAGPFPGRDFAWKVEDGDDQSNAGKEGFAGNIIFKFTRGGRIGPCRVIDQAHQDVLDPNMVRRGYYIQVAGSVTGNGQTGQQAGVYLNMDMIKFIEQGPEIFVGPSPDQLFGQPSGMPAQMPGMMPGMMPQQQPAQMPGMMPQQQPAQMPGMMPQQPAPAQMPGMMPQQQPAQMPGMMPQQPGAVPMQPGAASGAAVVPMMAPGMSAPTPGTPAMVSPSDPLQTPPAGTPGATFTTGLPQQPMDPNAASGAAPGAMNLAAPQMPGASPTASPSDLQQQGVQPQPGFLMPGQGQG
jgi:hypothetical protein